MSWDLVVGVVLALAAADYLIGRAWQRRAIRRAALRLLSPGPVGPLMPTPLETRGRFVVAVLPTFRGVPVPACPLGCAGAGEPCWEYCPEASTRNYPSWGPG